jgi:hypothetical protein
MIARAAASTRCASVRLSDRDAGLGYFVAFGQEENKVDGKTDDQWRVREKLIERMR